MQEWSASLDARNTAVKGVTPLEVTRIPSKWQPPPRITALGGLAKTARIASYIPLPNATIRSFWDGVTGKTAQDYIDENQTLRKNIRSKISDIDIEIAILKNKVDKLPNLQKQIDAMKNKRTLFLGDIEELDYVISAWEVEGARRAMIEGMNKGYVDRVNPFES